MQPMSVPDDSKDYSLKNMDQSNFCNFIESNFLPIKMIHLTVIAFNYVQQVFSYYHDNKLHFFCRPKFFLCLVVLVSCTSKVRFAVASLIGSKPLLIVNIKTICCF